MPLRTLAGLPAADPGWTVAHLMRLRERHRAEHGADPGDPARAASVGNAARIHLLALDVAVHLVDRAQEARAEAPDGAAASRAGMRAVVQPELWYHLGDTSPLRIQLISRAAVLAALDVPPETFVRWWAEAGSTADVQVLLQAPSMPRAELLAQLPDVDALEALLRQRGPLPITLRAPSDGRTVTHAVPVHVLLEVLRGYEELSATDGLLPELLRRPALRAGCLGGAPARWSTSLARWVLAHPEEIAMRPEGPELHLGAMWRLAAEGVALSEAEVLQMLDLLGPVGQMRVDSGRWQTLHRLVRSQAPLVVAVLRPTRLAEILRHVSREARLSLVAALAARRGPIAPEGGPIWGTDPGAAAIRAGPGR